MDQQGGRIGIGIVVRDEEGAARSFTRVGCLEPTPAEAMATFYGVLLCQALVAQNIYLGSDVQVAIDALVSTTRNESSFGHIVDDTIVVLTSFPQ